MNLDGHSHTLNLDDNNENMCPKTDNKVEKIYGDETKMKL